MSEKVLELKCTLGFQQQKEELVTLSKQIPLALQLKRQTLRDKDRETETEKRRGKVNRSKGKVKK